MDPWVAFVIGLVVGAIIGLLAGGFNKLAKDNSEFNKDGGYECNYSSEEPRESGKVLPKSGKFMNINEKMPVLFIPGRGIEDQSIYLMPNDGFDQLTRKKMNVEVAKKFGVIKFIGKDKDAEAKE